MKPIDLNADLAEGAGHDSELLQLVTSANICCGFHAGNPDGIRRTLEMAKANGVRIGAHPGHPDRTNFGRVEIPLNAGGLHSLFGTQISALDGIAEPLGIRIHHLKPHGALYHQVHREPVLAEALIAFARESSLPLVGLPGSNLERLCRVQRHPFIPEGFADRRYRGDGTPVPRGEPNAMMHDPMEAAEQVEVLVRERGVQTICLHGDTPGAVEFARTLRTELVRRGFTFRANS